MTTSPHRPIPVIQAQIAEVSRHLHDAPPHHGSGTRESLAARLHALQAELAAARRAAEDGREDP